MFIEETKEVRRGEDILLVMGGYAAHYQFRILDLFRKNCITVIAFPSHTSYIFQPLNVSMFTALKSYLLWEVYRFARLVMVMDALDIVDCVNFALSEALTVSNIRSGFERTGLWGQDSWYGSLQPLHDVMLGGDDHKANKESLEYLFERYYLQSRSLVCNIDVDESGTVKVSMVYGAHLTANTVLLALKARAQRTNSS